MEKTLKEILEDTGIKPSTFQKYKTMGLLPRPVRLKMLKGHGSVAYYPENTINLIRWIKEWQAEGETLKTIKERLGQLKDVTPKEEILIPVESESLDNFTKAYQKFYDEVRRRLDPESKSPEGFWIRFEQVKREGKNYYKITGALSPKTKE